MHGGLRLLWFVFVINFIGNIKRYQFVKEKMGHFTAAFVLDFIISGHL
jgi:uncharacterized membrane protein YpjA